jgi:hypothetical protein
MHDSRKLSQNWLQKPRLDSSDSSLFLFGELKVIVGALMISKSLRFAFFVVLLLSIRANATSNYEYKPDEYVVITDGRSPDGKYGNYNVTFSKDGTYSFVTRRENEKPDARKSSYKWRVRDSRNAVLDLGDDEVYSLKFQSPTQATGQVTDDVRTYKFTFSK